MNKTGSSGMELPVFLTNLLCTAESFKGYQPEERNQRRSDRKTDKIPDDEEDHPDHFRITAIGRRLEIRVPILISFMYLVCAVARTFQIYGPIGVTAFVGESPSL